MSIITRVAIPQILKIQLSFSGNVSFSGNEWKIWYLLFPGLFAVN